MNSSIDTRSGLGKQIDFVVMAAGWYLFASLFQAPRGPYGAIFAWALLASTLSMFTLGAIRYFEWHVPKGELSGVLGLMILLPGSALISWTLLSWSGHAPPIGIPAALRVSVWVALLVESSQWLMLKIGRRAGNRWNLKTLLLPEEQRGLSAQIQESGASGWIKIRPSDMKEEQTDHRANETLVISRGAVHNLKDSALLISAHLEGQRVIDLTELLKDIRGRVRLRNSDAWSFLLTSTHQSFPIRLYFLIKTFLEPILAAALIFLSAPLWVAVLLAVYFLNGRPIFYRQARLGYRGRPFFLYKFRTMSVTAEGSGAKWASEKDSRVTPLGGWLRRSHLDELPQLFNILRRELSFVGPRPERPEFYKILEADIPLFSLRLLVRPGVTGWAQSKQSYAGTVDECKTKLEYDLYYVQHMSPVFDLQIMIDTAGLLLRGNAGR